MKAALSRRRFGQLAATGAAVAAALPARAQSGVSVKWRLASSFPKNLDALFGAGLTVAKLVEDMSDGKFLIQPFAAGEIVPGLQVLDAVQNGTVECGHSYSGYYVGKNPALIFDGSLPFGMTARQHNAWYMFGDGKKLIDELYDAYNIVAMPMGNTGGQMFGWFRKEIKTPADFVGVKMRVAGFGGRVLAKLGVIPQQIAGGDIYPALEKGTIDAAEWVGPYDDEKLGLYKVAPHYYYPGWWEGGPMLLGMVNLDKWNALPKYYQSVLEQAGHYANNWMMAKYDSVNPMALRKLLASGTKLHAFSPSIMEASLKAAKELHSEVAATNANFKKVLDSLTAYSTNSYQWFQVAEIGYDNFMARHLQS
jgi:TRAP-type mannitol/chloroaromatic compound transport system substrate-binding protein